LGGGELHYGPLDCLIIKKNILFSLDPEGSNRSGHQKFRGGARKTRQLRFGKKKNCDKRASERRSNKKGILPRKGRKESPHSGNARSRNKISSRPNSRRKVPYVSSGGGNRDS